MATSEVEAMRRVVEATAPILKTAGFKKRRHSFNRNTSPGVVQVLGFQMGRYDPPGTEQIPGFRDNLYGSFTISLGVFLERVHDRIGRKIGAWVIEPDCHLRLRIGDLLQDDTDLWWELSHVDAAIADVQVAVRDHGLPWLDSVRTEEEILLQFEGGSRGLGLAPNGPLVMAVLRLQRGESSHAEGTYVPISPVLTTTQLTWSTCGRYFPTSASATLSVHCRRRSLRSAEERGCRSGARHDEGCVEFIFAP